MTRPGPRPVKLPRKPVKAAAAAATPPSDLLPRDRLEWVEAWGMASKSMAHVYRPSRAEGIAEVFAAARRQGRTVAFRGGGRSYGDAFQNGEEIVLDLSRMNRILEWNPDTGIVKVEPGVRIVDLWRYIVGDGWWPPVVSGTMFTTMGGCASMNIHGKNAYTAGPFGDHVQEFTIMLPSGEVRTANRKNDPHLFRGAIGGFGMLGAFTSLTLKMKRVYSGSVEVYPRRVNNFHEMASAFEENAESMDYMVGWVDGFARGKGKIGRGELHFARQLDPGEDMAPAQTLRAEKQEIADAIMGIVPMSILWQFMRLVVNNPGMKCINTAKYLAQLRPGGGKSYLQTHAAFHFLLDYVPNWKRAYGAGGLIQYQSFVPRQHAVRVFTEQMRLSQARGIVPYLGVTKKHLPDEFLISHGVDGYSMALDYPVTDRNRKTLWKLCHEMDEIVLAAGGRFYFAKDSTMREGTAQRYLPKESIQAFERLKSTCDPEGLLCTNLYRRIFGLQGMVAQAGAERPAAIVEPA